MALMTGNHYELIKNYLHPKIHTFISHYKSGNLIDLPLFHGCNHVNRNGTRKIIRYEIGEQCVVPINKRYWKKPNPKYRRKIGLRYCTRHLTLTNLRYLFKNKGNFVCNYKLKKYEHMNDTPMHWDFKRLQRIKISEEMSLHKKYFIHYCRVSVSNKLNTELTTSDLMLRKFDEKVFQTLNIFSFYN